MARVARSSTFFFCLLAWVYLGGIARAQDAGDCSPGNDAGICDGGIDDGGTDAGNAPPIACDGGLCDTTNGSGCTTSGNPVNLSWMVVVAVGVVAFAIGRRRTLRACLIFVLAAAIPRVAFAETPPAVDVVIHDEPPPRRILTIEYNPLYLIIGKFSASIVVAPIDHHALVLSPFYFTIETSPIYIFNDAGPSAQLPKQKFEGWGGELGYRYYFGERGPRGFFLGPSGIWSKVKATAQDGSETRFHTYGVAGDVGYQMLLADRVSLTLGAGVQWTKTSQTIPNQQFPANFNANGGVRPRLLASLGFAF